MTGKTKGSGFYNVIPRPDAWAWKTKRTLEHPNSDILLQRITRNFYEY